MHLPRFEVHRDQLDRRIAEQRAFAQVRGTLERRLPRAGAGAAVNGMFASGGAFVAAALFLFVHWFKGRPMETSMLSTYSHMGSGKRPLRVDRRAPSYLALVPPW